MMNEIRKIVDGNFIEGTYTTVNIDGNIVRRKVYFCGQAKDLYVLYKGAKYFYCEFTRVEE